MPKSPIGYIQTSPVSTLTPGQQKIISILRASKEPLSIKEISEKARLSYHTARKYAQKLSKAGFIKRISRGLYAANIQTQGVGLDPQQQWHPEPIKPKVHDLILIYEIKGRTKPYLSRTINLAFGNITMQIRFGRKHGKVSAFVNADQGLDYDGFSLIIGLFKREIYHTLGIEPQDDEIKISRIHLNNDHFGLQLDGVKSITVESFDNALKRVYQKSDNVLREEIQPNTVLDAGSVMTMLIGGVGVYNTAQWLALFMKQFQMLLDQQREFLQQQRWILEQNKLIISALRGAGS